MMRVRLSYDGEEFDFNLAAELKINREGLDKELKNHATSYAFISMLHVKLVIKHKELNKSLAAKKNRKIPMVRKQQGLSSLKEAEAYLLKNDKKLRDGERELLALEELKDVLEIAVKSFEYRKDLLQTISANKRRENN